MAGLTSSRNTPEWNGSPGLRYHYAALPVEASTSIFVGSMVALDANGNAVPAQSISGTTTFRRLEVLGIVEYVYAQGIMPPGIDALNQSASAALFPQISNLGSAGAISVGVVAGIFGMDHDSTVTSANIGEIVFAADDHTVTLGTLVANTTSFAVPGAAPLITVLKPRIVPGTVDAYSASGAGGTHYVEGTDFFIDYQAGLFIVPTSGSAIGTGATVFITYFSGVAKMAAGVLVAIDAGLAYVNFLKSPGYGF